LLQGLTGAYSSTVTLLAALVEMGFVEPERVGQRSVGLEEEWQAKMQARADADPNGQAALQDGDSPLELLRLHILEAHSTDVALLANYWTELPALLPHHLIDMKLVGKGVEKDGEAEVIDRFKADLHPKSYVEFLLGEGGGVRPDLAVAYNPGLAALPDHWDLTVDALLKARVPVLLTACCEADMEADMAWLKAKGAKVIAEPQANPLCSMLLEVAERQGEMRVVQANQWWWCIKGKVPGA